MSFYRRIKYFLVHTLMLNNKKAQELIDKGHVEINGEKIYSNCLLEEHSEIKVNGRIERPGKDFVYLKFYKPEGFESTLNTGIKANLSAFFKEHSDLAIAGRLDKQSEGLLLLSNDGKWVEKLCNPKFEKEKEYLIVLDKDPDESFFSAFTTGVEIGHYTTAPCKCERARTCVIRVVLKEGKNRQIRRMCKALGYSVLKLKRLRVDDIHLKPLQAGEMGFFVPIICMN
jgi:23S rRNA pseudouridine2604 synthase